MTRFDPLIRGGAIVALFAIGTLLLQPGFDRPGNTNVISNLGDALSNHGAWLLLPLALWLLWKPLFWAARLFLEGFFLGKGAKHSGVFRRDNRNDP